MKRVLCVGGSLAAVVVLFVVMASTSSAPAGSTAMASSSCPGLYMEHSGRDYIPVKDGEEERDVAVSVRLSKWSLSIVEMFFVSVLRLHVDLVLLLGGGIAVFSLLAMIALELPLTKGL